MPLADPGKLTQLGGEFVLSPGYNCDFAHRMTNTSSMSTQCLTCHEIQLTMTDHMEAPDVLREAGCPHPTRSEVQEITIAENQKAEFERLETEMKEWRAQRETELERIRRRRAERRGEVYNPMANASRMALGLDNDDSGQPEPTAATVPVSETLQSSRASSPSPSRLPPSTKIEDEDAKVDGLVCLPIESMEDVLAWDPETENNDKIESEKNGHTLDQQFTTAMKDLGIELGPEIDTTSARDSRHDTFGRQISGTGNGLDVTEAR